ncbi:MAG: DNA cytosine methyltransferase, partial [Candidatus Sigynarchaeota archaeon]
MPSGKRIWRALDLFCGAGGLSQGLIQAGFSVVAAVENWAPAADTYAKNHPSTRLIRGDIRDDAVHQQIYEIHVESGIDIIAGGFPCQGFSMSGNRNPLDSRSQLYREYLRVVAAVKPLAFIMENVKGLLSMRVIPPDLPERDIDYLREILGKIQRFKDLKRYKAQRELDDAEAKEFDALDTEVPSLRQEIVHVLVPLLPIIEGEIRDLGYTPRHAVLNAADFGTAQSRERLFIVSVRNDLAGEFEFPSPWVTKPRTSREAIRDLEDAPEG